MIITKGQSNELYLTLTEKCNLTNPYFVFFFKSKFGKTLYKVLTDISLYTERYNLFNFVEPTDGELLEGFWDYEVYESATSTTDITGLHLVEQGVLKVIDSATPQAGTVYDSQLTGGQVYE